MKINRMKSGIILHQKESRKRKKKNIEKFEGIPVVESYKYLGTEINTKIDCQVVNEKKLAAIERVIKTLKLLNY